MWATPRRSEAVLAYTLVALPSSGFLGALRRLAAGGFATQRARISSSACVASLPFRRGLGMSQCASPSCGPQLATCIAVAIPWSRWVDAEARRPASSAGLSSAYACVSDLTAAIGRWTWAGVAPGAQRRVDGATRLEVQGPNADCGDVGPPGPGERQASAGLEADARHLAFKKADAAPGTCWSTPTSRKLCVTGSPRRFRNRAQALAELAKRTPLGALPCSWSAAASSRVLAAMAPGEATHHRCRLQRGRCPGCAPQGRAG